MNSLEIPMLLSSTAMPTPRMGVLGFSAGGHLASVLATASDVPDAPDAPRPAFQVLIYATTDVETGRRMWGRCEECYNLYR